MNLNEILKALNRNLEKEYGSVLLYIQIANHLETAKEQRIRRIISRLAEDEMHHAEKIADKIAEMGGKSTWHVMPFERKRTVRENLEQIVRSEDESIEEYTALMSQIDDQPKLWITLKEILDDEKNHKARAEALLKANVTLFSEG